MDSMTSPRGPLPTRVYWVRRVAVLVTALALVFAIGRVLTGSGGADGGGAKATTVAHESGSPTAAASPTPGAKAKRSARSTPTTVRTPALSVPTGACSDEDVAVTPTLSALNGGGQVMLPLNLTTTGGTCTWRMSSQSLVIKISSGNDRIWSSQDCPKAIPEKDVVVRPISETPTQVLVPWTGRRSVEGCVAGQAWADPGWYHVISASLGGAPSDVQFRVVAPPRPTVTKTAKPKKPASATASPSGKATATKKQTATKKPAATKNPKG